MRTSTLAEQTAASSYLLPMALVCEMDLAVPLLLSSAVHDLTLNGSQYMGTRGFGKVEPIRDSAGEYSRLKFSIGGVPATHIALADSTDTAGKEVRIGVARFDPSTFQLISIRYRFVGKLDPIIITDVPASEGAAGTTTLEVTAESIASSLMRPVTSLYSDAEQQRLYPGDLFLQFVSDQAEMRVVWPAASWGRQ